ncbi:hypothetical protein Cyast_2155 [Cyanobacterium stanieri PCC 7202]|uniref:Uncharacterized protein n=1 Tax=Cyanobacterium stanieri (strain ATCC 29140 / PCC 7202) TaxID=292563 RepID=K9YNW1_CYASC|nr:hypothetical protein Cyast_2155 [Cyanobacterium stanieri PCC 7202]
MALENSPNSQEKIYYLSPSNKIHSSECRHCKPEMEGWQKMDSFSMALENDGIPCRLCCPSSKAIEDAKKKEDSSHKPLPHIKLKENSASNHEISEKAIHNKEKNFSPDRKRYKILAGNGCHQAIAEVHGILVPPAEEDGCHNLILPDGCVLEASFKDARLKWLAYNREGVLGAHWFRGYPKMKDNKLVAFQIVAWDLDMPTNERGWETWEFTGVWTVQKNLTVQRSMGLKEVRQQARETGFIKKFKYTFNNTYDWLKNKKLWSGYVYKLICRREGDTLKIQKVIPYACPRIKPVPRGRNNKPKNFDTGKPQLSSN